MTKKMKYQKADAAFSQYVRRRDANEEGFCCCPLCGYTDHYTRFTCGHYIKRRNINTRWYFDNGFAICAKCNMDMESNTSLHHRYGKWIMDRIGKSRWNALMTQSQRSYKWMQCEVDEVEKEYKKKTKTKNK